MNTQQLEQAKEMHDSGITWDIIASFFNTNRKQLRKQMKAYDNN